jgi:hypothetical protein
MGVAHLLHERFLGVGPTAGPHGAPSPHQLPIPLSIHVGIMGRETVGVVGKKLARSCGGHRSGR